MRRTPDECIKILELGIGETEYAIPSEVLEDSIYYIKEYQRMKSEKSWDDFPETMGK